MTASPPVVLVSCSAPDSPITAWCAATGTSLASLRGNAGGRAGLALVGGPGGIGCGGGGASGGGSGGQPPLVVSAQAGKAVLHTWLLGKEQPTGRAFAPEPVTSMAASPCGRLLAAGGASGTAWLWEAGSGRLLRAWAPHYRAVSALAWDGSASILVTGGGDGGVAAWDVSDLADAEAATSGSPPVPLAAWAHHTLPVAAVWAGAGGGAAALAASASADHTLSFYAPGAGALLRTLRLPSALSALVIEPGEHAAYAGGEDGVVYEVDLVGSGASGGCGGGGGGPAVTPLRGHTATITALAAPATAAVLLSGSADGTVRVWDARTRVPLRCLATPGKAPVAALLVLPPLLGGRVAAGGGRGRSCGMAGGGAAPSTTTTATTLPPLARPGAAHPRPWEGGLAALAGDGVGFEGRVAATGALGGGAAGVPGGSVCEWDCVGGGGGGGASSSTSAAAAAAAGRSADEAVRELEERLEAARSEAARWKALHGELMAEAAKALGGGGG